MQHLTWLFPTSAVGWIILVAVSTSWPRWAVPHGLPTFPSDLGGLCVLVLLAGTTLGGLALAGFRPPPTPLPAGVPEASDLKLELLQIHTDQAA